jgi:hypothetical protein
VKVVDVVSKGTVASRAAASALLAAPGDVALIHRGRLRWLVMMCPCGCGEQLPINLDPEAGPAWVAHQYGDKLSLYPSVWRDVGCESHFIVWRDEILLFEGYGDWRRSLPEDVDLDSVKAALSDDEYLHFAEVASALDAIPWDVLMACRELVKRGEAAEGVDDARGTFVRK